MRALLLALAACLSLASCTAPAFAAAVPERALALLPVLVEKQREIWPDAPQPLNLPSRLKTNGASE